MLLLPRLAIEKPTAHTCKIIFAICHPDLSWRPREADANGAKGPCTLEGSRFPGEFSRHATPSSSSVVRPGAAAPAAWVLSVTGICRQLSSRTQPVRQDDP